MSLEDDNADEIHLRMLKYKCRLNAMFNNAADIHEIKDPEP